jgi:hypothetical protein
MPNSLLDMQKMLSAPVSGEFLRSQVAYLISRDNPENRDIPIHALFEGIELHADFDHASRSHIFRFRCRKCDRCGGVDIPYYHDIFSGCSRHRYYSAACPCSQRPLNQHSPFKECFYQAGFHRSSEVARGSR